MTSYQVAEWLRKGIAAAQAGDTETAYELLLRVVDVDEYNEQAWLWLSSVVETDADREVCLENVLAINPDNKLAKAGLVHVRAKTTQPPPPLEPEPEQTRPEDEPTLAPEPTETEEEDNDWWDQSQTAEPVSELDDAWEERAIRATAPAEAEAEPEAEPETQWEEIPTVPIPVPTVTANRAVEMNTETVKAAPVRCSLAPIQTMASTSPESPSIPEKVPAHSQATIATAAVRFAMSANTRSV